jgi:hypothetical protein
MWVIADLTNDISYQPDMTYLHIKFHIPSSNSSLVIAIKLKARDKISTTVILLIYRVQEKTAQLNKLYIFVEDWLPYIVLSPYIRWSWCRFHLTSSRLSHIITGIKVLTAKTAIFWYENGLLPYILEGSYLHIVVTDNQK